MSSSSDENQIKQVKATKKSGTKSNDYQIKPAKGGPSLDTSTWPLLLKVILPYIY